MHYESDKLLNQCEEYFVNNYQIKSLIDHFNWQCTTSQVAKVES